MNLDHQSMFVAQRLLKDNYIDKLVHFITH